MFKVTFFIKEERHELYSLIKPLHFVLNKDNQLVWRTEHTYFIIEPFSTEGRESHGYRVYYNGSPEAGQYLFDRFLGCFSPSITGVEYKLETQEKQNALVKKSEQVGYLKGSMYGLYQYKGKSICIFPTGDIQVQIRNRKFRLSDLASVMKEVEDVVCVYRPQEINLFSFVDTSMEEEVFAS